MNVCIFFLRCMHELFKVKPRKLIIIFLHLSLKQFWTSSRCKDSIPAEANVWICYVCLPRYCEAHLICDSCVLVKPYKEKGKVPDRYGNFLPFFYLYICLVHSLCRCYRFLMECRMQHQQQQLERGEFAPCLNPSRLDSREPYDLHVGKLTLCTLDCFLCVYFIFSLSINNLLTKR